MHKLCPLIFAAGMCGAALPAHADLHQIGSVNVSANHYTHVDWSRFDGPVLRLRFVADNDTVDCEHVIVTYKDGTSHDVFSGTLIKGSTETITFPEGDSRIADVNFACKARDLDGARIGLSAISEGDFFGDRQTDWVRPAYLQTNEIAPSFVR